MKFKKLIFSAVVVAALSLICVNAVTVGQSAAVQDYTELCETISADYYICPELVEAIIESSPAVENTVGPMHLIESDQKDRMSKLNVTDLSDPEGNIRVGCDYLLELFEEYGDDYQVLTLFTGTSNIDYINSILDRSYELEKAHHKLTEGGSI